MVESFRVLVIDDDEETVRRLPGHVAIKPRLFERKTYQVKLNIVHVKVEKIINDKWSISKDTIDKLSMACVRPPHVIFADYGYYNNEVIKGLLNLYNEGHEVLEQDLTDKLLTPSDLVESVDKFIQDDTTDIYKRDILDINFLNYDRNIYLYSYMSKYFIKALGDINERANRTQAVFPNSKVIKIDTKYLFYNGSEFDWPNPSKHDSKFHAHLVGGLINNLIQYELLEYMLNDAKRLKYLRIPRSLFSIASIVAVGGAIGYCSQWLSRIFLSLLDSNHRSEAWTLLVLALIFVLGLGIAIPFLFERIMTGLMTKPKMPDEQ